jgi:hypothetical protein
MWGDLEALWGELRCGSNPVDIYEYHLGVSALPAFSYIIFVSRRGHMERDVRGEPCLLISSVLEMWSSLLNFFAIRA